MTKHVPYETIEACKKGSEEALAAILKHYEPIIVKASKRRLPRADGTFDRVVDEDIKAYIESELALTIMTKYDLTRIPRKGNFRNLDSDNLDQTG